jgi:hypothetical protein
MLHTDHALSRGDVGTLDAMAICHQTSPETAKRYQQKHVRQAAITNVQNSTSKRRSEVITSELNNTISNLQNLIGSRK